MSIYTRCDRCKVTNETEPELRIGTVNIRVPNFGPGYTNLGSTLDLCKDCCIELKIVSEGGSPTGQSPDQSVQLLEILKDIAYDAAEDVRLNHIGD